LDEYLKQVDGWESDRGYMEEHLSRWLRTLGLVSHVQPGSRILDVGAYDASMVFLIKRLLHLEVAAADHRRTENDRWLKRVKLEGIDLRFWDVVEENPPILNDLLTWSSFARSFNTSPSVTPRQSTWCFRR